jgi:hypothetical protein
MLEGQSFKLDLYLEKKLGIKLVNINGLSTNKILFFFIFLFIKASCKDRWPTKAEQII